MSKPNTRDVVLLSLIKGIPILSFNGKETTRIEKKGKGK